MWGESSVAAGEEPVSSGNWTDAQEVPEGQFIVGLKTNTESENGIRSITFLTSEL